MHQDMKDIKSYHGCSNSYMPSMELQKKKVVSVHCTFHVRHVSIKTNPSNIPSFLSSNLDIRARVAGKGVGRRYGKHQQTWDKGHADNLHRNSAKMGPKSPAIDKKVQSLE